MRVLIGTSLAILMVLLAVRAEPRVYTRAQAPSDASLNRLGLRKAWQLHLPMEGKRDGIAAMGTVDDQVIVQTYAGLVQAIDGVTGKVRWQTRLGEPYRALKQEVAVNERQFVVASGTDMFAIDRETGQRKWAMRLPGLLKHAPVADLGTVYFQTGENRVYAYAIPVDAPPPESAAPGDKAAPPGAPGYAAAAQHPGTNLQEPKLLSSALVQIAVSRAPVITSTSVVYAGDTGILYASPKNFRSEPISLRLGSPIITPVGSADDHVYFGTQDLSLYAIETSAGGLAPFWRLSLGDRIIGRPVPVGDDLFVVAANRGLLALNRFTDRPGGEIRWPRPQRDPITGRDVWPNTDLEAFLAASKRFVFAADRLGRTLVLDRQTGQRLGSLDTQNFAFRLTNDATGNVFLANHDGLVVCLRDVEELPVDLKAIDVVPRLGGGHDAVLTLQSPPPAHDGIPNALRLVFVKEDATRIPEQVSEIEVSGELMRRDEGNWISSGGILKEGAKEVGFVLDLAPRTEWPKLAPKRFRIPLDPTTLLKGMNPTGKGRLMVGFVNRVGFSKRPLSNTVSGAFDFNPAGGEAPK